jgi:hypothetical protein
MPESLLSPSRVLLYGRIVQGLNIAQPVPPPQGLGVNRHLLAQLGAPGAGIARIYSFSYEGHYYDLAKPALFLVHGLGDPAEPPDGAGTSGPPHRRVAKAPADVDLTGYSATAKSFPDDMMVWQYDKGDFSIRLDVETGTFEQILLECELKTDRLQASYAGSKVRLRGPGGGGD